MKNIFNVKKILSLISLLIFVVISNSIHAAQQEQAYTTAYRYSPSGLLTGTISPDPDGSGSLRFIATRNTYTNGLLTTVEKGELGAWADENTQPGAWSGFTVYSKAVTTYDPYGRKASVTVYDKNDSTLSVTEYSYDYKSRLECTAVRMDLIAKGNACASSNLSGNNPDRITRLTYNEFDQVTTEERAVGTSIQQNYVTNVYIGRYLKSQVDANCNKTELRYNNLWQLNKVVYPAKTTVLAAGQTCDKPSVANTLPTKAGSVNENDYVEYRYDGNGNKNYERKRNGTSIAFSIDNNNRVTFKDYSNASMQDISYNYDLRGLQLSARFGSDSGGGITNKFDGFGGLVDTTNNITGTARKISYGYDLNGNRSYIKHPDNQYFSYTYDQLNRIKGVSDSAVANDSLLSVTYQNNGRRDKITRTGGSQTGYVYTNGVQLKSFSQSFSTAANNLTNSFLYNAVGQVTSLSQSNSQYNYVGNNDRVGTYTSNGLNQYSHIADQPMGYDLNGNMINDGLSTYTFDDENRLLTASGSNLTASLVYDPNGRLSKTTINNEIRDYLYDGDALVAEYVNGTLQRRYVHGDQIDEPWVQYNGANVATTERRYLHANHQGSIIAHSNSSGNVINTLAYDAYGIPASMNVDTFAYTGQIYLKALNLYYYKARIYSPKIGRFLQTDPIGYKDQMNLYAYVGNDPVNYNDPTGESRIRGTFDSGHVDVALEILVDEAVDQVVNKTETGSVANNAARHLQRSNETLRQAKATHGNSRVSTKSQHRYEIRNKATGDVVKTGISGRPLNSNGTSPRANSQVNAINKTAAEGDKVEGEVKEKNIPGREAALNSEQAATNQLNADGHSLERQCRPKPNQSGGC